MAVDPKSFIDSVAYGQFLAGVPRHWRLTPVPSIGFRADAEVHLLGESLLDQTRYGQRTRLRTRLGTSILFVASRDGEADIFVDGAAARTMQERALIFNHGGAVEAEVPAGATLISFRIHPNRLAAAALEIFGQARVFQAPSGALNLGANGGALLRALKFALEQSHTSQTGRRAPNAPALEQLLAVELVHAMLEQFGPDAWGSVNESVPRHVRLARAYIIAHREGKLDMEAIFSASGVSGRTVRRGFVDFLGMPLNRFIRTARLDYARQCLGSSEETRSVKKIAEAIGYRTYDAFAHAYMLQHGEAPSRTRQAAFRPRTSFQEGAPSEEEILAA